MRVIFATNNAFLPDATTGLVVSTNGLARSLIERGHHATVLAGIERTGRPGWHSRLRVQISRNKIAKDERCGYPVYRAWAPWDHISSIVADIKPDIAVVQGNGLVRLAKAFLNVGIPVIVYIRDVEFSDFSGSVEDILKCGFIANSNFTAGVFRSKFGVNAVVIPPIIDKEVYRVSSSRENVTFINPDKKKGVDLAFQTAEGCPTIPFRFVESWALSRSTRDAIKKRISLSSNISYQSLVSDVRDVYCKTKILLAPSMWEEAWGRVASEAQVSGIPVIGSRRGGLPEAIGPGGIVLDFDRPISEWIEAVRCLWYDDAAYKIYSDAALAHASRSELCADSQLSLFVETLSGHVRSAGVRDPI